MTGTLILAGGANDDAVRPDLDDVHRRAWFDRLPLRDRVDHLTVDFDGAAWKHLRAGDADAADQRAARIVRHHVVFPWQLAKEGFAHARRGPVPKREYRERGNSKNG